MNENVARVAQCLYERDRQSHRELHERIQTHIAGKGKLLQTAWENDDNNKLLMPKWRDTTAEYRKGWYDEARAAISALEEPTTAAFSVGDVIKLKSGGPKMTVTCGDEPTAINRSVRATWFAEDGRPRIYDFRVETVELVME